MEILIACGPERERSRRRNRSRRRSRSEAMRTALKVLGLRERFRCACTRSSWISPSPSSSSSSSSSSSYCFSSSASSGNDELEEFLDKHLSKASNTPGTPKQSVATTRKESLALYRDILRFSRFFTWTDNNGIQFRHLIRESARKEYEAARFEKDPHVINKLIVSGRDSLEKSLQNVIDKQREIVESQQSNRDPTNPNDPFHVR